MRDALGKEMIENLEYPIHASLVKKLQVDIVEKVYHIELWFGGEIGSKEEFLCFL